VDRYLDPGYSTAALLTIDVQNDVLAGAPFEFASPEAVIPNMVQVVQAFRTAHRPIVHVVRLYLRDGSNADLCRRTSIEQGQGGLIADTEGSDLVKELKPSPHVSLDASLLLEGRLQPLAEREVAMFKPRWGAFFGTPLSEHLGQADISTVVVIGCNFPNCPRTSIYEASERDFRVVAVTDAISRFDDRDASELADIGVVLATSAEVAGSCLALSR
jgi:nicotinamidase-related amidase